MPKSVSCFRLTPTALAVGLGLPAILSVAAVLMPLSVAAADAVDSQAYAIAAGPLEQVANEFARQSGLLLSFDPKLVAGKQSSGLSGHYSARSGLTAVLAGSGVGFRFIDERSVLLEAGPAPAASAEGATLLGAVKVEATADATTERSNSYTTRSASTSSRLPLTLRETPQSVTVVSRQQIEDRNFVTLDEAMETVPGITATTANFNRISYSARGFALTDNMIDGLPSVGNAYAGYVPNLAFFDHVEVLRGSAGLAYGAPPLVGSAGGTVNLVRKKPTEERQLSATLRRGSWNNNYAELDASGPLNASGALRGRLVVSYEDRETFIDDEYSRKPAVYGIVESDLGKNTLLHVGGSLERFDGNFVPYGLPRYTDGSDLHLPRSSRGLAPAWTQYYTDVDTLFAGLEQRFGENWKLRIAANHQDRVQGGDVFNSTGAVKPDTLMGPTYGTSVTDSVSPGTYSAYDALLSGSFDVFGRRHEVIVGGTVSEIDGKRGRTSTGTAPALTQSIFDFDPWAVARPAMSSYVLATSVTRYSTSGIYGVGRLSLSDPLKLILGARLSNLEVRTETFATNTVVKRKENDVFNPYAGLVYDFAPQWSAYASYSDIFRAQNTLYTASGETLEPVVGVNYETGVKGEFYDGQLNVAFAVFRVEEKNRSQVDPDNQAPCAGTPTGTGDCYIAEGKVHGQGFETELSGQLLPGLQASAGYTYVKTEYLHDRTRTGAPSTNEGKPFNTITPKHLFRIWTNYHLPADWHRFSVGAGINAQSKTYTQSGDLRIGNSSYLLLSGRAGYQLNDNWDLGVNGNNLLDKRYYQRLGTVSSGNRYGEPQSWTVSLRGRF